MSKRFILDALMFLTLLGLLLPGSVDAAEMGDLSGSFDGKWRGTLLCVDGKSDFKTQRSVSISDGKIAYRKGVENQDRFEIWHGVVSANEDVFILGRYFWKEEKHLFFRGTVRDAVIQAEGQRGPKSCSLKLSRVADAS